MQLSCDYHATSDQFIMTNVMLPCGIFKEYQINFKNYQIVNLNHLIFKEFDSYTWTNSFMPRGQIVLCHVATLINFETFKIKVGG